jgi:very-short-patch-repair endonuclease
VSYKPPSKIAERVYKALRLSGFTIIPEYNVGGRLRVDFLIRELSLCVEVDGQQHTQFTPFMHGDKDGFRNSKKRDNKKQVLLEAEGLRLVRLSEYQINNAANPQELLNIIYKQITPKEEEEW